MRLNECVQLWSDKVAHDSLNTVLIETGKDNACHRFEMTLTSSSSVTINLSLNKSDLNFNFILFKKDVLEATGIMLLNDENFLRNESKCDKNDRTEQDSNLRGKIPSDF